MKRTVPSRSQRSETAGLIDLVYGVEVFTNLADVPAELQATKYNAASCGVVAIWTESMR